jgi:hypothetical protein
MYRLGGYSLYQIHNSREFKQRKAALPIRKVSLHTTMVVVRRKYRLIFRNAANRINPTHLPYCLHTTHKNCSS